MSQNHLTLFGRKDPLVTLPRLCLVPPITCQGSKHVKPRSAISSHQDRIDKIDYSQVQPRSRGGRLGPQWGWLPAVTAAGGGTLWVAGFFFNRIRALPGHLSQDLHKSIYSSKPTSSCRHSQSICSKLFSEDFGRKKFFGCTGI